MKLPPKTGQLIAGPATVAVALIVAGAAAAGIATEWLSKTRAEEQTAKAEREAEQNKLARATEEEREIREKLVDYRRLVERGLVGEERRLDWIDRINAIKAARKLLEVKYSIDPQRPVDYPGLGGTGEVEFLASLMRLEMALLHEEDLLRFIGDLRSALSAYVLVRSCTVERLQQPSKETGLAPRLRATCEIDLVTIRDKRAGNA